VNFCLKYGVKFSMKSIWFLKRHYEISTTWDKCIVLWFKEWIYLKMRSAWCKVSEIFFLVIVPSSNKTNTVSPRNNGHICFLRFCRYNKSAIVKITNIIGRYYRLSYFALYICQLSSVFIYDPSLNIYSKKMLLH
jgi:hypothetical protein